jgi:ribosome-associated toxin RatA of RatAB toxin-antitoxin module
MKTETALLIPAPAQRIYALAAEVERWPILLPHYRWVTLLERKGNVKLVEMAASRDGFPVRWQAVQRLFPDEPRITFRHVRGVTRGMDVEWRFEQQGEQTVVTIYHQLTLHWPLIGNWVADRIIGPLFVDNIAGKTLRCMRALALAPETRV